MTTKETVLRALSEAGEGLSGAELSKRLGLSRNAVWKAVEALRSEGHEIEAVTNRGYRLHPGTRISETGIRRCLRTETFGHPMELHEEIDSTNSRAKALAVQGAPHGTLVCARRQTGGRGRLGRSFFSPEDSGIYMSLILRPKLPAERAVMLTSMAAVAAARAVERLAEIDVKIKWVNDLYANGKKLCGILCEAGMDFESGQLEYAVVGVGVNVSPMEFPEELREIATSVGNECGCEISKDRLIAEICGCMEELYGQLETGEFMEESRARSNVIGRRVTLIRGEERVSALAVDIDDQGGLVADTDEGRIIVRSGEISLRWEDRP